LRTCAIPEHFCGGDSLQIGAISSVCTFTFNGAAVCVCEGVCVSVCVCADVMKLIKNAGFLRRPWIQGQRWQVVEFQKTEKVLELFWKKCGRPWKVWNCLFDCANFLS